MNRPEKRLEIALEAIKQQITLATGILGVTLAFSDQVTGARQGRVWSLLPYAFAPLAVSIICGVYSLMSISYHLRGEKDPLVQGGVRVAGILQNVTFLIAIVAMVVVIAKS